MEVHQFYIFTFLSLSIVASSATLTPEEYWKSVLPNTPMPKTITSLLHHDVPKVVMQTEAASKQDSDITHFAEIVQQYFSCHKSSGMKEDFAIDPSMTTYFLEKEMHHGKVFRFHFSKNSSGLSFLPRYVVETYPFSSNKLPEIFDRFSVKRDSPEAKTINATITTCEMAPMKGEETHCATSLEDMVDYMTSKLGKNVQAISTEVDKELDHLQNYTVVGVENLAGEEVFACHKLNYAYVIFNCHKFARTKTYRVSLVSANGTKARALTTCHADTSSWDPEHLAFKVVKVKPGAVPICHFLFNDAIAWLPSK